MSKQFKFFEKKKLKEFLVFMVVCMPRMQQQVLLTLRTEMRKSNKNVVQGEPLQKNYFELIKNYSSKMH